MADKITQADLMKYARTQGINYDEAKKHASELGVDVQEPGLLDAAPDDGMVMRGAKGLGRGLKGLFIDTPAAVYHAAADEPKTPEEAAVEAAGSNPAAPGGGRLTLAAKRLLYDPQVDQANKAQSRYNELADTKPGSKEEYNAYHLGNVHKIGSMVPLVGAPAADFVDKLYTDDDKIGAVTELGGMTLGGSLIHGLTTKVKPGSTSFQAGQKIGGKMSLRGALGDRVIPESGGMKTGEVYQAARDADVPMNMAQAGRGKFAQGAETVAEHTLGGSGVMDRAQTASKQKYSAAINKMMDTLDAPSAGKDIAERGTQLQQALASAQEIAHDNASTNFKNLDQLFNYGTADMSDVVAKANELKGRLQTGELKSMYPKEAIAHLDEIINNYGDLHNNKSMFDSVFRDRSRLMKSQFTDAKIPGEGESAMRQMAGAMRDSLEKAAIKSGNPKALEQFNAAMKDWSDYHDAFGDRGSPIYKSINGTEPTKLLEPFFAGKGSLRAVQQMDKYAPEFKSMLKRDLIRRLLDPSANGTSEGLGKMTTRLGQFNEPFVKALFTPQELSQVRRMARVGEGLGFDDNPSGSAKTIATATQISSPITAGATAVAMGHPVGAVTAAGLAAGSAAGSYGLSRILNHQGLVDYLMDYGQKPASKAMPAAKSGTAMPGGTVIQNPFRRVVDTYKNSPLASEKGAVRLDALLPGGGEGVRGRARGSIMKTGAAAAPALDKTFETQAKVHAEEGGSTFSRDLGNLKGRDAFAASIFPERTVKLDHAPTAQDFADFSKQNDDLLAHSKASMGSWFDEKTGKHVLDVVATPSDLAEARKLGKTYDQKSIWDLKNEREIATGGTGGDRASVKGNQAIADIANDYNKSAGLPEMKRNAYLTVDPRSGDIADAYEAMQHNPNDPEVAKAYDALKKETAAQWDHANKHGIIFEPTDSDPYKSSAEMMKDVAEKKRLKFLRTDLDSLPGDHPMAEHAGDGLSYNDKFRAVHDLFGHAQAGYEFGARGEENAFMKHAQMYSDDALPALATETKGQNSWVNNGKHIRESETKIAPQDRPFAEQKAGLLPKEYQTRGHADRLDNINTDPDGIDAVHYSNVKGLKELDPSKYGTSTAAPGARQVNRPDAQMKSAFPEHWNDETYLGTDSPEFHDAAGHHIISKENRYKAELNAGRYYDATADPENFMGEARKIAQAGGKHSEIAALAVYRDLIKKAGYSGRVEPNGLVVSYDKVPVKSEPNLIPPGDRKLLTTDESNTLGAAVSQRKFNETRAKLPSSTELADAALAGADAKEWYQRGGKAFDALAESAPDYFKEGDRKRFGDFFAAFSPQTPVKENIVQALDWWKKWNEDGRPTDTAGIQKSLKDTDIAGARIGNATLALQDHDMLTKKLDTKTGQPADRGINFKVGSFGRNMNEDLDAVTNDAHMGVLHGLADMNLDEKDLARPAVYHAISVATREAAKQLGWKPAEAQAAMWVFTKTIRELGDAAGNSRKMPAEILGKVTPEEMKQRSADIADLMKNDPDIREHLQRLGVNLETLDSKIDNIGGKATVSPETQGAALKRLGGAAERIFRNRTAVDQPNGSPKAESAGGGGTDFNFGRTNGEQKVVRPTIRDIEQLEDWPDGAKKSKEESSKTFATDIYNQFENEDPDMQFHAVKHGDKVIAAMSLDTAKGSTGNAPVTIDTLATHPEHYGQGAAKTLVHQAAKVAAKDGVGLSLYSSEGARAFYEKLGFQNNGIGHEYTMSPAAVKKLARSLPTEVSNAPMAPKEMTTEQAVKASKNWPKWDVDVVADGGYHATITMPAPDKATLKAIMDGDHPFSASDEYTKKINNADYRDTDGSKLGDVDQFESFDVGDMRPHDPSGKPSKVIPEKIQKAYKRKLEIEEKMKTMDDDEAPRSLMMENYKLDRMLKPHRAALDAAYKGSKSVN